MSFKFFPCYTKEAQKIDGLWEVIPAIHNDNRGHFFEAYNKKAFFEAGLTMEFVQDNQSYSKKGVLRGIHFQLEHPQGKLVSVLSGKVYDVVVDLRNNSKTFGSYHGLILDSDIHNQLYIPEGFGHGFYVLSDFAIFAYKCSDFYFPNDECGIIWDDPTLNIDWKQYISEKDIILSEKDKKHELFDNNKIYY